MTSPRVRLGCGARCVARAALRTGRSPRPLTGGGVEGHEGEGGPRSRILGGGLAQATCVWGGGSGRGRVSEAVFKIRSALWPLS
jgi:hypothetical protein